MANVEMTLTVKYENALRRRGLEKGILYVDKGIEENLAFKLLAEISEIDDDIDEVTVIICSPGGGAYYAFSIYDALMSLRKNGIRVKAIVNGWAASAASMIVLQAADERVARPNARFLLHEARRWIFWAVEKTSELEDEVAEMKAVTEQITHILADRCGRKQAEVEEMIRRKEVWMSAQEALEWGLIDKVE